MTASHPQYFIVIDSISPHSNSQLLTAIHCDEPNTGFEPRLISAHFFCPLVWLAVAIYTLPAKLHKKGGTNRLTPFIDKSCRIKIFDCFVKTVMRNEYRDAAAEKKRIQNREAKPDLMNVPEIEDVYPSEHFILDNEKYPCLIASDWLYDAMLELPKTQRETLILEFWYGYDDQEIAAYFHVTPRTIYNWRQKAFTAIRKYYERNGDERKCPYI